MTDQIQANYDQLDEIAGRFANQAQEVEQMIQKVRGGVQELEDGKNWTGRAANAFFSEINGTVLPANQRLLDALHEASQVVKEIAQKMKDGETEAAAFFQD